MAENNMMSLKVFLRDDGTAEARRFTVDASVVTSYIFMKEKLQTVFPSLRNSVFKITWKDSDGDEITIASDEDFITALTEMNTNVKVLYVTIVQHNTEPMITIEANIEGPHHGRHHIICDICNQAITGCRYKCLQCPDYDLCANCEHQGHHSEHIMMRVPNNDYPPKCARKLFHHIAKGVKKSAYAASKEAHRAKYAKCATQGKFSAQSEQPTNEQVQSTTEQTGPNCSFQQPQASSCPFVPEESINLDDVHALGALTRKHFGPILDALRTAPQTGENNIANDGLFMDIIRNAVDGFFGYTSAQPNKSDTDKCNSDQLTADNKENSEKETPMDVEGGTTGNKDNTNIQQDQDKRDPGWIFVNEKPSPPEAISSAPAFVSHENPRIAEGLVQLHEMGFSNESGYLAHLLERFEGNINAVVKEIIDMKL